MPEVITSAANPLIKRVRLLADRRHRRREGEFVVHGVQPVWQAVQAGADIATLIVAPDLLRGPAAAMVAGQAERGVAVALVSAELFGRISDRDGPAGLAAIVRMRPGGLGTLPAPAGQPYLALHEVGNPGNLGTIIRTVDAAGAAGVILLGATTDPYDPAAVKASMGALFSVPVVHCAEDDFFDWCGQEGITVVATSARGQTNLWEACLGRPAAFLLGSEGTGLPAGLLGRAGLRVRIPMAGTARSLNLAVAAGVLLYEARRREQRDGGQDWTGGSR